MGQITATLFFIIVAYLISNFSKNMIIILGCALLLTNILMVGNSVKEGLENGISPTTAVKDAVTSTTNAATSAVTNAVNSATGTDKKKQQIVTPSYEEKHASTTADTALHSGTAAAEATTSKSLSTTKEEEEPKVDEGMNIMNNKKRNRIDYASTIEEAYGDLNKILGSDGIKRLTDDTQRLMSQQLQLADAMKSMTPLMENAKSMLQGFDLKNLDGLSDLAKSFAPSK